MFGGSDATGLDVEATGGPGVGALGPGLPKAGKEPHSPDDEPYENEYNKDEEQGLRVESELGMVFIPDPVFRLIVDHFI